MEGQSDVHNKLEAESNSTSSPIRTLGPFCDRIDAQNVSVVRFRHSTYGWKDNKINFPMARSHANIQNESSGNNQTSRPPESDLVLHYHILVFRLCIMWKPLGACLGGSTRTLGP
jgi:hypothetical protein